MTQPGGAVVLPALCLAVLAVLGRQAEGPVVVGRPPGQPAGGGREGDVSRAGWSHTVSAPREGLGAGLPASRPTFGGEQPQAPLFLKT